MEKNKVLISDSKEADIFVRQLLNIGEAMYQSGGEISRIEDSLRRLGKVYGALHVSVFALTSSIAITVEFPDNYSVAQNRRFTKREMIDSIKMEKLNQLCRECAMQPLPVIELREKVLDILKEKPNEYRVYLGQLIAAMTFTVFFGGSIKDACIAGFGAILICLMQKWVRPYCSAALFFHVIVSFVTGLFVDSANLLVPGLHVNQILIGDIMVLIPGAAITNSIRYILSGDMVSSLEKLMDSLLQAFGIATGFMLALLCVGGNYVDVTRTGTAWIILQLIAAAGGTLGFCLMYNLKTKYIWIPMIGGFLCWSIYLLLQALGTNAFVSALAAAFAVGVYGEIFARIVKVPTTLLFMPACIPLVPGGHLYYSALAVLASEWSVFEAHLVLLIQCAVGIAVGLAIVVELEKLILQISETKKQRRGKNK